MNNHAHVTEKAKEKVVNKFEAFMNSKHKSNSLSDRKNYRFSYAFVNAKLNAIEYHFLQFYKIKKKEKSHNTKAFIFYTIV